MGSIEEEVAQLNEEYPLLEEARYAWTLHYIWKLKGLRVSGDLRADTMKLVMRRKADQIIKEANSFRMVAMGMHDNKDFFHHPDLLKKKRACEEKIRRKKQTDSDRRIAQRYWIEATQDMRRKIEKEKKQAEEERAKEEKLRESMESLCLKEQAATDACEKEKPKFRSIELAVRTELSRRQNKNKKKRKVKVVVVEQQQEQPPSRWSRIERFLENEERKRKEEEEEKENSKKDKEEEDDEDGRHSPEL